MDKLAISRQNVLLWILSLIVILLLLFVLSGMNSRSLLVIKVEDDGRLVLNDGRTIDFYGIKLKTVGDEKYEAAKFVLNEMISYKGIWIKKEKDAGYMVWIGCVRNILGFSNCSRGLLVNDELVRVGAAERR